MKINKILKVFLLTAISTAIICCGLYATYVTVIQPNLPLILPTIFTYGIKLAALIAATSALSLLSYVAVALLVVIGLYMLHQRFSNKSAKAEVGEVELTERKNTLAAEGDEVEVQVAPASTAIVAVGSFGNAPATRSAPATTEGPAVLRVAAELRELLLQKTFLSTMFSMPKAVLSRVDEKLRAAVLQRAAAVGRAALAGVPAAPTEVAKAAAAVAEAAAARPEATTAAAVPVEAPLPRKSESSEQRRIDRDILLTLSKKAVTGLEALKKES